MRPCLRGLKAPLPFGSQGERPHNQLDADMAGGLGKPDNGPRLRSAGIVDELANLMKIGA